MRWTGGAPALPAAPAPRRTGLCPARSSFLPCCAAAASPYLASGTDDGHVKEEAALLGLTEYFRPAYLRRAARLQIILEKNGYRASPAGKQPAGRGLLGFGDGYVEIEDVKAAGGFACGVASNEKDKAGRGRMEAPAPHRARADIIIPDYRRFG